MHSGSHQQVNVGMQRNLQTQANGLQSTPRKLWGHKFRIVAGMVQIFTGVIEIFLGIVVVSLPSLDGKISYYHNYDHLDSAGWGIWCGAFVILTGCCGICSQRKKHAVLAYMVMSIISSVMCAACIIGQITSIAYAGFVKANYDRETHHWSTNNYSSSEDDESDLKIRRATAHQVLYIILLFSSVVQGISSIFGASFTCGAMCKNTASTNQEVVHYQPTQGPVFLSGPAYPYVQAPVFVSGPAPPYVDASSSQPDPNLAFDPQYPTKN